MASGEMSEEEFIAFLKIVMNLLVTYSRPGSLHYLAMDWRHIFEIMTASRGVYSRFVNMCVWAKRPWRHGLVLPQSARAVLRLPQRRCAAPQQCPVGPFWPNRTTWAYPGINTFGRSGVEGDLLALHPTVKPVSLIADALLDASRRGDIVLDPFMGSGSTLSRPRRSAAARAVSRSIPFMSTRRSDAGSAGPARRRASRPTVTRSRKLRPRAPRRLTMTADSSDDGRDKASGKFVKGQSGIVSGVPESQNQSAPPSREHSPKRFPSPKVAAVAEYQTRSGSQAGRQQERIRRYTKHKAWPGTRAESRGASKPRCAWPRTALRN